MKSFCNLRDRLNSGGRNEAAMTGRTTIEWIEFRKCGELLKKALSENEKTNLSKLCKTGNVAWMRDMGV